MNKKRFLMITGAAVLTAAIVAAYMLGRSNKNDQTITVKNNDLSAKTDAKPVETTPKDTTKTPTSDATKPNNQNPIGMTSNINKFEGTGLLNASYTRKLTDFTAWQESGVSTEYRDFNQDGVNDAFVWAKIPGTKGYSFAAVWTLGTDNKPKELWYLPTDQYVDQSSWAVNSINTMVNSGKKDDNGTIKTDIRNWHWQDSGNGSGVVLEPNI